MTIESTYDGELKPLLGKRFLEVHLTPEKELIAFVGENVMQFYKAEGDCCSHSWIENLTGVNHFPGYIIDIEELDYEHKWTDNDWGHTEIKQYGIKFTIADKWFNQDVMREMTGMKPLLKQNYSNSILNAANLIEPRKGILREEKPYYTWIRHRHLLLEYRNESNGYYGGSLEKWEMTNPRDLVLLKDLKHIKEDF